MKKKLLISVFTINIIALLSIGLEGCFTSKKVSEKSGPQLWGENCSRCHNAPGPGEFNNDNWEVVGMHMQVRANLVQTDVEKIIDFLKSANN